MKSSVLKYLAISVAFLSVLSATFFLYKYLTAKNVTFINFSGKEIQDLRIFTSRGDIRHSLVSNNDWVIIDLNSNGSDDISFSYSIGGLAKSGSYGYALDREGYQCVHLVLQSSQTVSCKRKSIWYNSDILSYTNSAHQEID